MIHIMHEFRYWTEYLETLLDDSDNFSIIRSFRCDDASYKGYPLETFDQKKHRILLSAGYFFDETFANLIICRYLHSPGFNIYPTIGAYFRFVANHFESDFRFMLLEQHYRLLLTTEHLPPEYDEVRYKMITDPRVSQTKVDTMLFRIRDAEIKRKRQNGTALLSLNWVIAKEDPRVLEDILRGLSKHFKVTLVVHPFVLVMGDHHYMERVREMSGYERLYCDITRDEMVDLYDEHEYVVTDGSGTVYEAMIRGCKPLLVDDLPYQKNNLEFHAALEGGFLPFPNYREIYNLQTFDSDSFIEEYYPFLNQYSLEEAETIMKEEILALVH